MSGFSMGTVPLGLCQIWSRYSINSFGAISNRIPGYRTDTFISNENSISDVHSRSNTLYALGKSSVIRGNRCLLDSRCNDRRRSDR